MPIHINIMSNNTGQKFLDAVRKSTKPGDSILISSPACAAGYCMLVGLYFHPDKKYTALNASKQIICSRSVKQETSHDG